MSATSFHLVIRFALEMFAIFSIGYWGYKQGDGWNRYVWAICLPIAIAVIWGIFNVPNDPSRSGAAPVVVSGVIRLIIELAVFGFATYALHNTGFVKTSILFGGIVLLHYAISYERIKWLLQQ